MNRLLIGYIIFSVGALGFLSFANAEEYTVVVPFTSHGVTCEFQELSVEYHCVWQGFKEVYTLEDLKEYKELLTAERYDQEIQKLNEQALAEIAVEQAKLTPNEKTIQKIEEKLSMGIATATESVYMNLLKEFNTCKQGMDRQTAPFQEPREFEISEFNLWQVNNVPVEGHLGELVMAVEECRGQQKLLKVVGEGYSNMPTGEDDKQFSLLEHFEGVQALNFDDHTATHRNIDKSLICGNNQFPLTHQAQFGCEVLYDGKTVEQIKRENEIRFGTDGKIQYQSQVLDDYMDFLNNYGNKQATVEDKKVQELIAEPIANEWKEDNNFYQNHKD
mgnify:CR=1 FL=1